MSQIPYKTSIYVRSYHIEAICGEKSYRAGISNIDANNILKEFKDFLKNPYLKRFIDKEGFFDESVRLNMRGIVELLEIWDKSSFKAQMGFFEFLVNARL